MAKFGLLESLGPNEWEKPKARADIKVFFKIMSPPVRLLKIIRLLETLE